MDYFCNEPIINIYEMQDRGDSSLRSNWWLQEESEFAFHVTNGFWFLLETKNYFISLGEDGVVKYKKPYKAPYKNYKLGKGINADYIVVALCGQRIKEIKSFGSCDEVIFDDFSLMIYKYRQNNELWFTYRAHGCGDVKIPVGGHLLKDCDCGGRPEIFFDHVDDYFIRCNKCHKSTYSDMRFKKVVNCWNKGDAPIFVSIGEEKFIDACNTEKLIRIVADASEYEADEGDDCWVSGLIFEFEKRKIMAACLSCREDMSKFSFSEILEYNPEVFSKEIVSLGSNITFKAKYQELDSEEILLQCDGRNMAITTTGNDIHISFWEEGKNLIR